MHKAPVVLLVCCCLALPSLARGADPSPKEQARRLFLEGNDLFGRGMFLDALDRYRKARDLYPSFKIDLNIGGTLDALGRRTDAAVYYERFLLQSQKAPPDVIQSARERLDDLRKKLARVNVSCLQDGAVIVVDGQVVGQTPLELPVYVNPGAHTFSARKEGFLTAMRTLRLKAGEESSLDLALSDGTRAKAAPPVVTPPPPSSDKPSPPLSEKADSDGAPPRRSLRGPLGYAALGLAGGCVVAAAVLYGLGGSQGSEAHEAYRTALLPDDIEAKWQDVQAAQTKLIAGHALVGAAVLSAGVGTYLLLTRPETSTKESPGPGTAGLAPTRGGAVFTLEGAF